MKKISIKQFYPPALHTLVNRLRSALRTTYQIGNIEIAIPRHIDLPNIQKSHPAYDRFLPILCKFLDGPGTIVDVGANIGDTAIAIAQVCNNPIVCIEPSPIFYSYLTRNLKLIPAERSKAIQKMIGTGTFSGNLDHSIKGTARLSTQSTEQSSVQFVSLDSLKVTIHEPILLKSDTDGFDFDVLLSAKQTIKSVEPVLFWENEVNTSAQLEGFARFYQLLEENHYEFIYVFDNFGNLLLEGATVKNLVSLNNYLVSILFNGQTRTFYYVDIMAVTKKHWPAVNNAICAYKETILSKKQD
jgi:FkbM family methyltransferase